MAGLEAHYTIPSSGLISPIVLDYEATYDSEIRAVFLHISSLRPENDWDLIAQTLDKYGISVMVVDAMSPKNAAYQSDVIQAWAPGIDIDKAVSALHRLGIEFYIAMEVLYGTPNVEWGCVDHLGNFVDWLNPLKQGARDYLKAIVEELVTKHPEIDGFMFDYIRWEWQGSVPDMPYCDEAKIALEEWLGETVTNFPGEFAPGGSRYKKFLEWRIEPITQTVADMSGWMKAIKPDLKITAAVWTMVEDEWAVIRKLLGQDWADWVMKDYLDWVAPMDYFYPRELESLFRPCVRTNIELGVGGPEGKIPIVIFIANQYPVIKTPEELKSEVDVLRQEGADGWIIWRYTGPGVVVEGADIQPYLDVMDLFPVFSLRNIGGSPTENSCTITWDTDLPSTSKVEYSTSQLFIVSSEYDFGLDFDYLDIDHNKGTIVEDLTPVMDHIIVLTGLLPATEYYFHVQSEDSNGVATSRVYTFATGDIGSPP